MTTKIKIILAGGGHAHLLLLKNWPAAERPNVEITLISEFPTAVYSGMVPGYIAGTYTLDEIQVDLAKLAAACRVNFLRADITGLDLTAREVITNSAGSIKRVPFDVLSLDVGSRAGVSRVREKSGGADPGREFSIKPLQTFLENWRRVSADPAIREIDVIGGGAAGLELALAMASALRLVRAPSKIRVCLHERASRILPQMPRRASRIALKRAQDLGVEVQLNSSGQIGADKKMGEAVDSGARARFVAAGPTAPEWFRETGLDLSAGGFICIDEFLRAKGHANIFAVGDCAEFLRQTSGGQPQPIPRSGVYAVRQSPVLLNNLRAACEACAEPHSTKVSASLQKYHPQKRALYLLSLGDLDGNHKTMFTWGLFAFAAKWLWYVKRWIDRRYMRGLQNSYRQAK